MGDKKKVLVGMSGGVDSSVAALLLKNQGYEVAGGTFRIWDSASAADVRDAESVCEALGIPHYIFDFRALFMDKVIDDFARVYERGETPNPCVVCNRVVKFGAFLEKARELGYDYISTGHYAHIVYDEELRRFRVKRSDFIEKDQSYVLYSLTQRQLSAALMPLGGYDKRSIRELAAENNLITGRKAESQDICFIPDGNYAAFLRQYLDNDGEPGDFVGEDGRVLGRHKGIRHYTIGQRKGLGLSFDKPMFVAGIDSGKNTVVLAPNEALMQKSLLAKHINWIDFDRLEKPLRLKAKIRYNAKPADAVVTPAGEFSVKVLFDEPQRAITAGQSVVFYDGDYLAGGGIITICAG